MSKPIKNTVRDIKLKGKCTVIKIVQTGPDSGNSITINNSQKEYLKPNKFIPLQEKEKILNKINYAKNKIKQFNKEKNRYIFLKKGKEVLYIKKANSNANISNKNNKNIKQYASEKMNKNKNNNQKEVINKIIKEKNENSLLNNFDIRKNTAVKVLGKTKNNLLINRNFMTKSNTVDENLNNNLTIKNNKNSYTNLLKDDEIYRKPSISKNFSKQNFNGNIEEISTVENHLDTKVKKYTMPLRSSSSNIFKNNIVEVNDNKIRKTEFNLCQKIKVNKIINNDHQKNYSLNYIRPKYLHRDIYKSPHNATKKLSNKLGIKNDYKTNSLANTISIKYTKKNIRSPLLSKNKTPDVLDKTKQKLLKTNSIIQKKLKLDNKNVEIIKIKNNNLFSENDLQIKNKKDEIEIDFKNKINKILNTMGNNQKNNHLKIIKRNRSISFSLDERPKNNKEKKLNKSFAYLSQNEDSLSIHSKTKNKNEKAISSSKKGKSSLITKEIFFHKKNINNFNDSGSDDIMNSNNNSYSFKNNNSYDYNDSKNKSQNNISNSPLKNYYSDYYNIKISNGYNEKLINTELLNNKEFYNINFPLCSYSTRNLNLTENFGNRVRKFSPLNTGSQPFYPNSFYNPYDAEIINRINTISGDNNIRYNNNNNNNMDFYFLNRSYGINNEVKSYVINSNNDIKTRNSQEENIPNLGFSIIKQTTPTQSEPALSIFDNNINVNGNNNLNNINNNYQESNSTNYEIVNDSKNIFEVSGSNYFKMKFVNNIFSNKNNEIASDITEILNKITPKNYQIMKIELIPKIITKNENNEDLFVNILYPFAINQKNNQTMYAKLCKDIDKFYNKKEKSKSIIRNQLMKLCKFNFKKIKTCLENINLILNDINFIGELINVQMVSKKVGLQCLNHLVNKFKIYNSDEKYFEQKNDKYLYLYSLIQLLNLFGSCIFYQKEKIRQDELTMFENEISNHIKLLKEILIDEKNTDMPNSIKFYLEKLIEKSENNWKLSVKEEYKFKLLSGIYENNENNNSSIVNTIKKIDKFNNKFNNTNEKKINLNEFKLKYGSPIKNINLTSIVNTSKSLSNKKKRKNIMNKIFTNSNIKVVTENKTSNTALIIQKNLELFKIHVDKFKTGENFNDWAKIDELFLDKKNEISEVIVELVCACEIFLDNKENNKHYIDIYIKIVFEYYFNYLDDKDFDNMVNRVLLEISNLKIEEKCKFDVWVIALFYLMENKILEMKDFNCFIKGYSKDIKKKVMILMNEICCYNRDKKYYYFKEFKNSKFALNNKSIYLDVIKEKNDKQFNGA